MGHRASSTASVMGDCARKTAAAAAQAAGRHGLLLDLTQVMLHELCMSHSVDQWAHTATVVPSGDLCTQEGCRRTSHTAGRLTA